MKTQSIGFGEAVRILAADAGMQPYRFSNFDKQKDARFQNYKNIYNDYSFYFHKQLFNEDNKEALNYLSKRGVTKKIIEEFKLGFVPWKNHFYEELLTKYSEAEINLTGLFYKNDKTGKYVDRFNSRIIFPINNITGDTIAFGGRILKDGRLAKYINSPETEFYKKGNMIFNLDKAKSQRSQTNEIIIVEGYMDVLSVYSSGVKNVIANSGTALTKRQIDLIWRFFSSPIICLDGDESGQKVALRIAENLFPHINEKNKIFFSIMPEGNDPDDFIKKNGKDGLLNLLKEKKIIQSYIWNYHLNKVDQNNPLEISKFEKEIKRMSYSIQDETVKKYVLEDFLEKIKKLTPLQTSRQNNNYFKYKGKRNFNILKETKILHKKKESLSKIQIIEFSILFLILNYFKTASKKIEEISEIEFFSEKNENLKNSIISSMSKEEDFESIQKRINSDYKNLLNAINENSNIQIISNNKNDQEILELLEELLADHKEQTNLKKIESLEQKLINNLDESSFSELIKLKSQLNRD